MLAGCRRLCSTWAAIGLLLLAAGVAAGIGDLVRVGTTALIAFGSVRLAMASDHYGPIARRLGLPWSPRAAGSWPPRHVLRTFFERPAPYALIPSIGLIALLGRIMLRPPLGGDARLLVIAIVVAALGFTVLYLGLLAARGGQARALRARAAASGAPSPSQVRHDVAGMATTTFVRDVLGAQRPEGQSRP